MIAILWLSGRICRTLVKQHGNIIDSNEDWNNIASAEAALRFAYPDAVVCIVRDLKKSKELDREWNVAICGN